jgi:hypothetical protein
LRRDGVAIDWHESVGRLPAADLFRNPFTKLVERIGHEIAEFAPVRGPGVPSVVLSRSSDAISNASSLGAEIGVLNQFLDVSHPIGPLTESVSSDRASWTSSTSPNLFQTLDKLIERRGTIPPLAGVATTERSPSQAARTIPSWALPLALIVRLALAWLLALPFSLSRRLAFAGLSPLTSLPGLLIGIFPLGWLRVLS